MSFFRALVIALLCASPAIGGTVTTVSCIKYDATISTTHCTAADSLVGAPHTTENTVIAAGYYLPGDGGGDVFYRSSCTSTDDGIDFLDSTSTNCFSRRFTGTVYMAWFGVQQPTIAFGTPVGSSQDVGRSCPHDPTNDCWKRAFIVAQSSAANNTVSTGGMYLFSSKDVTPQAGQTLTCDAPLTQLVAGSDYSSHISVVGGIVLAHPARIHIQNAATEFHHCVVLSVGQQGTAYEINLTPNTCHSGLGSPQCAQREALNNTERMVSNGDIGVFCDGPDSNYIHDIAVIGFDTGIASFGCSHWRVDNVNIDAAVPIYLQANKSPAFINHVRGYSMLAANVPAGATTHPVTSITANTSGACEVTLASGGSNPVPVVAAGDWVTLQGDSNPADEGPLSCYGTFQATPNGSSYDLILQNTVYGPTSPPTAPFKTVHGRWVINSNILNVDSVDGIQQGECMTSNDSAVFNGYLCNGVTGVMVRDVSYHSKKVTIALPTQDNSPAPTSAAATLSFSNNGVSYSTGSNVIVVAGLHADAGTSIGGQGAGGRGTCVMGGGPGDTSNLGFVGGDIFCFDHRTQYNAASLGPFVCHGCGFDSQAAIDDIQQIGVLLGTSTNPLPLLGTTTTMSTSVTSLHLLNSSGGSVDFNPAWAGWRPGDTLIAVSNSLNGQTIALGGITNTPPFNVTLNSPATGTGTTLIYDVNPGVVGHPGIINGSGTSGTSVITLAADPALALWRVGDVIASPTLTAVQPGTKIIARDTPTANTVTLDLPLTATIGSAPIADLTVYSVGTGGADFVGSSLGGGGGVIFDSAAVGCNTIQGSHIAVNNNGQPALEVVQGCAAISDVGDTQNNDFLFDASAAGSNVLMTGTHADGMIMFEGHDASGSFTGSANNFPNGGIANTLIFGDRITGTIASGYPCPATSRSVLAVFCGGDGTNGTAAGNTYESCNHAHASTISAGNAGCVATLMDKQGNWKHLNSASLPIYEYNDTSQALLPTPYEDGIQGKIRTSPARILTSSQSIVATCVHPNCTSGTNPEGVYLPASSGWIDASATPTGSPCASWSGENCGVAGGITVINTTGYPIQVWCYASSDKVNLFAASTGYQQTAFVQTYYPVNNVGWFSH